MTEQRSSNQQPLDQGTQITPLPRISIQAFCETADLAALINEAAADRRMDKTHVKVHMGGAPAAIEAFRDAPTPNVIVMEANHDRDFLHDHLDELAQFCDPGTKVVIVGRINDIMLYRSLMTRGVSEYLVLPFDVMEFIASMSALYTSVASESIGRVIAFVGAKGGVGASTIAHNVAWSIAKNLEIETVIVDLDLAFGTAGLNLNQDPPQGVAEAVYAPDRLDSNLLDRLLSKCSSHLNLLAAPATLDRVYDFQENAFDSILDILRSMVPCVVLDVPHVWNGWVRRVLTNADDVIVVAGPDLANLRNSKSILDVLRTTRPNDHPPRLILNGLGMIKRPEITAADFSKTVELDPMCSIPFDAKLFGTAANNGQMLAEVDSSSKQAELVADIGRAVMGRPESKKAKKNFLEPLKAQLAKLKAS